MGSIIKSVSMDLSEHDFLKDYNLSPTQLLKEKIWEMKGVFKKVAADTIAKLKFVVQDYSRQLDSCHARIDELENELAKQKQSS